MIILETTFIKAVVKCHYQKQNKLKVSVIVRKLVNKTFNNICANCQAPYYKQDIKALEKQAEVNFSCHFLHSCFELT